MLGNRPLLGAALGSIELPPGIEDPITAIAKTRGAEFAVIFEVTGFPKQFAGASGGATPLLGAPLLSSIGIAGEEIIQDLSPLTLWLSDYAYRTKPSDIVLPNMWTEPRMTRRADIEQTAPVAQGGSRSAQTTTGDVEFADNDGYLRDLSHVYSFENRPAKVHLVRIGRPWVERATVSESVVGRTTRSNNSFRFTLGDASSILDTPLVTRVYSGTGLRDGTAELKGTAPPIGFGPVSFAKPLLEDPSIYLYRLSDYGVNAVSLVEERGIPFNFAGDFDSYELLRVAADSLAEGEYATCLVDGSIVIKFAGGSPLDPDAIRVSFEGDKSSGTYVSFLGDVTYSMIRFVMGVPDSRIDKPSFDELPLYPVSYYFGGGSTSPTGAQALNTILGSAFGVFGSVNNDRIGAKLYYPPGDQPAASTLVQQEIFSVEEIAPPQDAIWSQEIGWGANADGYTRDQLAVESLTEEEVDERTRSFEGVYKKTNTNVKASNLSAVEGSLIESVFTTEAGAIDAVERLMGVWGVDTKTYEVEASFAAADIRRGSVISMTHHDFGSKSGGKFLVYGRRLQLSKRRVLLTVVG